MANFRNVLRTIGNNVYRTRNNKRLSQDDFAKLTNLPRSTLSTIENGKSNVSLRTLALISEALNVSINELMSTRKQHSWDVGKSDLEHQICDEGRVRITALLPKHITTVQGRRIEIDENGKLDNQPNREHSKEYLTILSGELILRLEHEFEIFTAGTTVHFRCDQTYSYENAGEDTVVAIAIALQVTML